MAEFIYLRLLCLLKAMQVDIAWQGTTIAVSNYPCTTSQRLHSIKLDCVKNLYFILHFSSTLENLMISNSAILKVYWSGPRNSI